MFKAGPLETISAATLDKIMLLAAMAMTKPIQAMGAMASTAVRERTQFMGERMETTCGATATGTRSMATTVMRAS
jgi:hypothetical protein